VALLPGGHRFLSSSNTEGICLWEVNGAEQIRRQSGLTAFINLPLSADGRLTVLADRDYALRVWDVRNWESGRLFKGHKAPIRCVRVAADGRRALSSSWDKAVLLWDVATGKELCQLGPHPTIATGVALSPDGRWGATGGGTGVDPKTGASISLTKTDCF